MLRVEKSRKRDARKPWRVIRVRPCPYEGFGCDQHSLGREHRTTLSAFWSQPEAVRYARKTLRIFPRGNQ